MALPELAVMQQTFDLLDQLDPHARRRVLRWVKAALDDAPPSPSGQVDQVAATVSTDQDSGSVTTAGEEDGDHRDDGPAAAPLATTDQQPEPLTPTAKPRRKRAAKGTSLNASTPAAAVNGRQRRPGRPPADEIMRVYQEVDGKLTDLAEHYGKSYATIQGWASALRQQGYPIGRSRKS